jgi:hypothetical protein
MLASHAYGFRIGVWYQRCKSVFSGWIAWSAIFNLGEVFRSLLFTLKMASVMQSDGHMPFVGEPTISTRECPPLS